MKINACRFNSHRFKQLRVVNVYNIYIQIYIYVYNIYVYNIYVYNKLVYTNYLYLKRNPPESPDCSSTSSVRATLLPPTWANRYRCLSCGTIDVPASLACWRSSCSKRLWKLLACATSAIARATVRRLFGTTRTHDRESERIGEKKKRPDLGAFETVRMSTWSWDAWCMLFSLPSCYCKLRRLHAFLAVLGLFPVLNQDVQVTSFNDPWSSAHWSHLPKTKEAIAKGHN